MLHVGNSMQRSTKNLDTSAPTPVEKPTLLDLISLEELQQLQDTLAAMHQVASLITNPDGRPLTVPSNEISVCRLIRSSSKGLVHCMKASQTIFRKRDDEELRSCRMCERMGILKGAVPIVVDKIHLADWWVSQYCGPPPSDKQLQEIAEIIGMRTEVLSEEFKLLPKGEEKKFLNIIEWIKALSHQIAAMAYENHVLSNNLSRLSHVERELDKYRSQNVELQRLAALDDMTQIANRRRFENRLSQEWSRNQREKSNLAVIICDIDFFKAYNDTYGHIKGDEALYAVAQAISETLKRPTDLVARFGGEEFAIILPNTDISGARQVAEEVKKAIADLRIEHKASMIHPYITVSFGGAALIPSADQSAKTLIEKADRALYRAKSNGRNRIFCASP